MDLRQLRYFAYVAEHGSITKASEYLNVAQPAVSRTIRGLEEELGVDLLERNGRGVTLTEAGEELIRASDAVFDSLRLAKSQVMSRAGQIEGRVALGLPPSFGVLIAPNLMRYCSSAYPDIDLELKESYSGFVQDWLSTGNVDLAILNAKTINPSHIRAKPFATDEMFLIGSAAVWPKHLATNGAVSAAEAAKINLILPTAKHGLRSTVEDAFLAAGARVTSAIEVDSVLMIKELVHSGFGLTILPKPLFRRELEAGQLIAAPIKNPAMRRKLVIATSFDRPLSKAAQAVEAAVVHVAHEILQQEPAKWGFELEIPD
ncbi:LysR family transcriptional regulator [Cognatishimia maritima]|uniref:LysR family transcriptional regulator, nitrogen assimilation regulatory protein n=1 Tax=Cognatishimia maritima TaxID=870908 RepID=A0A1M5VZB7_9RHOB|nr:LysR family transcriptional regulator [Cognatishimia maritima]SHH80586.1 LysR family transcriptional regulator, nitrogen assimilation regulatory protein [Cognatishimia maritima]